MSKDFIDSSRNDSFSCLRGLDLKELLIQIEQYFLDYRDSLNLSDNLTFGVEIEYENVSNINEVDRFIDEEFYSWKSGSDGTVEKGGEIRSPIMSDDVKYWQDLKKICDFLTSKKADTSHNAGGHIHIGAHILGDDVEAWKQFIKVYTAYENVLFRFAYGDKLIGRPKINEYAHPIAAKLYNYRSYFNDAKDMSDIEATLPTDDRYYACNFTNVKFNYLDSEIRMNTLEFRNPNATTDAVIWQNNINTFAKMLISSKYKIMDEEFLNYKLEHEFIDDYRVLYNIINLKNALEFVDLIFDNNLDKVYFLRQYFKNFQECRFDKNVEETRNFVKR